MAEENTGTEGSTEKKGTEFVPPKDGSWLPKDRVNEMVGIAKDAARVAEQALEQSRKDNAALQAQLSKNAKPDLKHYSREDLAGLVEREDITQLQADTLWDKQLRSEFEAELDKRFDSFSTETNSTNIIQNDMSAYMQQLPDLKVRGTKDRTKVEKEFGYLRSLGEPDNSRTELLAVRNVFGPIETLKDSLETLKKETHKDAGGAGGNSGTGEGGTFADTLTAREKAYYETGLANGLYKDWKEIEDEMKFANQSVRKANGAKV